jgi:SAM-dependent methyltransferase
MDDYLQLEPGMHILDIGCGPGHIVRHLPEGTHYTGIDVDERSIAFAKRTFGGRGRFIRGYFDATLAESLKPLNVIMMNGVMHHIADDDLARTLQNARAALASAGILFTLDGCYAPGQSRIAKWLLDNDRGGYVREAAAYRSLLSADFDSVEVHVRDDLAIWPYTFAIGLARNDFAAARVN